MLLRHREAGRNAAATGIGQQGATLRQMDYLARVLTPTCFHLGSPQGTISSFATVRGMGKGMSTGESPEVQSDAKCEFNSLGCDAHLENKENAVDFTPARQAMSPYISVRIGGLVIEFCNKPRFLHAAAYILAAAGIVAKVRYGA